VLRISGLAPCIDICAYAWMPEVKNARRMKTTTSLQWRTIQYRILCKPGSCSLCL